MPPRRSIPATTSSAPAICGTRSSRTKLTASTRGRPAAARRLTSSARVAGSSASASFWRPSRGPTSQSVRVNYSSKPEASTCWGVIRTVMRSSSGLRHGYSSWPRYFFASRSIWPSAPSVVSSAVPLTATHL